MPRLNGSLSIAASVLASIISATVVAQQPPAVLPPAVLPSLVFDDVTVVDVSRGTLVPHQRVRLAGNHIAAIGNASAVAIPTGAKVVAAQRQYLIPGLWDMHLHVAQFAQVAYPLLIANGVTGERDMHPITGALDSLRQWRREILAGQRVGPRTILTGGFLGVSDPTGHSQFPGEIRVTTPAQARQVVDSLKAAGADFIKVRRGLTSEVYFAAAAEARHLGIPLAGHFPGNWATPTEVSDSGQHSIEHGLPIPECSASGSDTACATVAARFRRNDTWLTPTFVLARYFFGGAAPERLQYWPGMVRAQPKLPILTPATVPSAGQAPVTYLGEKERAMLRRMQAAGMRFLAGSDGNPEVPEDTPGFALHEELVAFVEGGLTPAEALQTATLNPAAYFGATDTLGTVAVGKLADLVLLDADPLADIHNTTKIAAVVANGHYYDRAALDHLMAEVIARAKSDRGP